MPFGGALVAAGLAFSVASAAANAAATAKAGKASAATTREAAEIETRVSRELHEHWKAYYLQCDAAVIQEVCAFPHYDFRPQLIAGRVRLEVLRNSGLAREKMRTTQDIYNTGAYCATVQYLAATEARALTDGYHYAWRYERAKKEQWEQIRLGNRYRQLALGRNMLTQASALNALAASYALKGAQKAGEASQGWAQLAGYLTSERGAKMIKGAFDWFSGDSAKPKVPDMKESGSDWSRGEVISAPADTSSSTQAMDMSQSGSDWSQGGSTPPEGQGFGTAGAPGEGYAGSDYTGGNWGGSAT